MNRLEITITILVIILTILGIRIEAQAPPSATINSILEWDQAGENIQSYEYKYYLDGAVTGFVLNPVTCVNNTCSTRFPTVSPGNHTLQLTAQNEAGESTKSSPFAFAFVVTPSSPSGIRIR